MQTDRAQSPTVAKSHLYALDGFRALLALWVYFGHLAYAVGYHNYLLGLHALAVDLFMVLSGFLMARSWTQTAPNRQSFFRRVLQFYNARFFRIAPLYYLLLIICYIFLPSLTAMYDFIQRTMPPPWAQSLANYNPSAGWNFDSLRWFYLHATFTFGLVPSMEASTPLPDWSLSLEMQFYFIFPALFWLMLRVPSLLLAALLATLAVAAPLLFGNYLTPGTVAHFGQPSLLLYRLNAFLAGMLIAYLSLLCVKQTITPWRAFLVIASCVICIAPLSKPVIAAYAVFCVLTLVKIPFLTTLLSTRPLCLLGQISYSLYLAHVLVIIPIAYWLLTLENFVTISATGRFIAAATISTPLVILISYGLFRFIEQPFIQFSKRTATAIS